MFQPDLTGKTAIKRKQASLPARKLFRLGLIKYPALDWGCGYGMDAEVFGMQKMDPAHGSQWDFTTDFETILCTYVFNVTIPLLNTRMLEAFNVYLKQGGKAYITVRRDIPKEGTKTQRYVELNLPKIFDNKNFCTYVFTKD